MVKHQQHAEFMLRVVSRAGVPVSQIEREAGVGHGVLGKYLRLERVINPYDLHLCIQALSRHDRSAADELAGYFQPTLPTTPQEIDVEPIRRFAESLMAIINIKTGGKIAWQQDMK